MKMLVLAVAAFAATGLMACSERQGEQMDSAIEEATQDEENMGDGPFERAGEAADDAAGRETNNDLGDTLNDATDGDERTDP